LSSGCGYVRAVVGALVAEYGGTLELFDCCRLFRLWPPIILILEVDLLKFQIFENSNSKHIYCYMLWMYRVPMVRGSVFLRVYSII
jgi:hypothetical protein